MAAVVLQGGVQLAKQQAGVTAAAVSCIQHAQYSSDVRVIRKPLLSQMRKGTGGRSSFNGVVATVFGSSGFLGRHVCNELGKHGSQLILPYRGDFYDMLPLKLVGDLGQVLFQPFNLRDENSIRRSVKYSNVVVNLIGRDWETKNFSFNDVHVDGARRIAKIAREEGVEKFIHVSALNVSPNPQPRILRKGSGILKSKYYGEMAVREEFPDAVIIRPSLMWGSEDRFLMPYCNRARRHFNCIPIWNKGLDSTKMPIAANDVAKAIYEAIKDPYTAGQVYQAVGPHRYSYNELIQWIAREMRFTPPYGSTTVTDARFDPIWFAKSIIIENMPGRPIGSMTREILERNLDLTDISYCVKKAPTLCSNHAYASKVENPKKTVECTPDQVVYDMPKVRDLGVQLTPLEDEISWIYKPWKRYRYLAEEVGDSVKPDPAPIIG